MKRIEKFDEDQMMEVLAKAKIAFDPEAKLADLHKLAVNNIGKFVPALDKLHPLPVEEEEAKEPAKPKAKAPAKGGVLTEDVEAQVQAILEKAQEKADQIIANAMEVAGKANIDAVLKPEKKKYTEKQLHSKVSCIAKKRWECEMNGTKIKCEKDDVFEVELWMQIRLAGQGVV